MEVRCRKNRRKYPLPKFHYPTRRSSLGPRQMPREAGKPTDKAADRPGLPAATPPRVSRARLASGRRRHATANRHGADVSHSSRASGRKFRRQRRRAIAGISARPMVQARPAGASSAGAGSHFAGRASCGAGRCQAGRGVVDNGQVRDQVQREGRRHDGHAASGRAD
jgi:hypothetical protein